MFNEAFASSIPLQGTEIAARWDGLYSFLVWLSVFFFILVVGGMLYFIVAYRHQPNKKTKYITGNHLLEGIWIAIPTLLLLVIFGWGYSIYHSMTQPPADAMEVRVIGKQWMWTFQYEDGRTSVGELFVPVNQPVKLVMTSEDVLHSFFVPNFRVKQDVVPGMYTSVWFTATVPGKHQVFCTEYCGTSHSEMLAQVVALDETQWKSWMRNKPIGDIPVAGADVSAASGESSPSKAQAKAQGSSTESSLVDQGKLVYQNKGCMACHSIDGSKKVGPTLAKLYGSKVELVDGRTVTADENFIRKHIEEPNSATVKGYSPVMPTFKGLISETEMNALIAFIKSLK